MRRQTPIAHLLHTYLFPRPTPNDPPTFSAHLARNLVPEVRIEVATYYGDLNSAEARYPGLDYCHPPHRMRLGRFKHHRRLFDAFDALGLTDGEIQGFCCWEGTRWARERYERDEGITVRDTTGEGIGPYVERRRRYSRGDEHWAAAEADARRGSITRKTEIEIVVEDAPRRAYAPTRQHPRHAYTQRAPAPLDHGEDEDEGYSDAESGGDDEPMSDAPAHPHPYHSTAGSTPSTTTSSTPLPPLLSDDRAPTTAPTSVATSGASTPALPPRDPPLYRHDPALATRLLAAYRQGQLLPPLPPHVEQFLKEQSERAAGAAGANGGSAGAAGAAVRGAAA